MLLDLRAPTDLTQGLAARAKALRLSRNLTQAELAARAGVSLPSLKRFEARGAGSLDLAARVALVLEAADAFEALFAAPPPRSLDEILAPAPRRRASPPRKAAP